MNGVRETCDLCDTTLFNMHWVCHKCGFVVCIDCYSMKTGRGNPCKAEDCPTCEAQGQRWLKCSVNRLSHEPEKLMLTQIIPDDGKHLIDFRWIGGNFITSSNFIFPPALWKIGSLIYKARDKWCIASNCLSGVNISDHKRKNGIKPGDQKITSRITEHMYESKTEVGNPLSLLADVASYEAKNSISGDKKSRGDVLKEKFNGNDQKSATLRDLLSKKAVCKLKNGDRAALITNNAATGKITCIEDVMMQVAECNIAPKPCKQLLHYVPKHGHPSNSVSRPQQIHNITKTMLLYPHIEHAWLDNGRLLRLINPKNPENAQMFQQQWKLGKPVMISNCQSSLKKDLWRPEYFCKEFGELSNDLVNCTRDTVIIGKKMKHFWNGFEHVHCKLRNY